MELVVQILLLVIGGLFVALMILGNMYKDLKDDYEELSLQYFIDVFEEKKED